MFERPRLQSFPDWYEFEGTDTEQMEQIGNSVAPLMSLALAKSLMRALQGKHGAMVPRRTAQQMEPFVSNEAAATDKVEQALNVLRQVGVPLRDFTPRRWDRIAKALLAMAGLTPDRPWSQAMSMRDGCGPLQTRAIIRFWNEHYGEKVADSSYDDVRRKDLVWLVKFGVVFKSAKDPDADVNDGTRGYALSDAAISLLRSYGTADWEQNLIRFRSESEGIADRLSRARQMQMVPVALHRVRL